MTAPYKSAILKTVEKDAKAVKSTDKAITRAKADKAQREKTLREDQIIDGVKAVAEKINEYGANQFTAREIGQMIGYHEAFVKSVIDAMEAE